MAETVSVKEWVAAVEAAEYVVCLYKPAPGQPEVVLSQGFWVKKNWLPEGGKLEVTRTPGRGAAELLGQLPGAEVKQQEILGFAAGGWGAFGVDGGFFRELVAVAPEHLKRSSAYFKMKAELKVAFDIKVEEELAKDPELVALAAARQAMERREARARARKVAQKEQSREAFEQVAGAEI